MKFYGQFDPPVDRFIFERYFPDLNIRGIFVECGAFDGALDSSCRFFEESAGWTGYNIEAVPHLYQKLVANRPTSKNLQVALSSETGSATFKHAIHPDLGRDFGNGSIDHSSAHMQDLIDRNCTFEEFSVQTMTWSDFINREGITHVDLFVLDVEGHELSVLEGMKGAAVQPGIMCVEFGHIDFGVLVSAMDALGYQYDIHSWANAYFVRTDLLSLFALRRSRIVSEPSVTRDRYDELANERDGLLAREAELVRLVNALENSRAMKTAKALKALMRKMVGRA